MSPFLIIAIVALYFGVLMLISRFTSDNSNHGFFSGNKQSPWYVVAFGMIGTSLSGVTFISVPGWVDTIGFTYMQMVLGYVVGYMVIITVLLPLYYRLNLTSIYTYLEQRFGHNSYQIGAWFFMVSRIIGAAFRLYLVAMVFEFTVFSKLGWDIPFWVIVLVTIGLIWLYTSKGGMKTIIWTDTLQTAFMLIAVVVTLIAIGAQMDLDFIGMYHKVLESGYAKVFVFDDVNASHYFWKDFLSGALISIVMTGLDQDMMQKNLTCKSLPDAQKNMAWFSASLVVVNLMFLALGALLYIFANKQGVVLPEKADQLYPMLATDGYLGTIVALFFVLGLIAAAYSSADSALTALTTSFSVDILRISSKSEQEQVTIRKRVHIGVSLVLAVVIIVFSFFSNSSVISDLFKAAGYTYGPILGLFTFGIFTKRKINDAYVWPIAIASPVLAFLLNANAEMLFDGYKMGYEILLINGVFTFGGLLVISSKPSKIHPA